MIKLSRRSSPTRVSPAGAHAWKRARHAGRQRPPSSLPLSEQRPWHALPPHTFLCPIRNDLKGDARPQEEALKQVKDIDVARLTAQKSKSNQSKPARSVSRRRRRLTDVVSSTRETLWLSESSSRSGFRAAPTI